ncbi:NifB/NifX family molybdenum-iron cluster-binding protein [Nitratifractor sp.]
MLTAIPLKMNKPESAVSPLFGHAKWFAFVDDEGKVTIEANPYDGGMPVIEWLLSKGVGRIVTQHIGAGPFRFLLQQGVEAWYPGEGRILLSEALERIEKGEAERITPENIDRFARHQHRH